MRKVALVFVLAVFVPSLVLAWLAVRSLSDQQFVLERQQSLLYQGVTDALARQITDYLAERQREFSQQVESLVANQSPRAIASGFDDRIRRNWPFAEVGFCVTLSGNLLAPSPAGRLESQAFCADNAAFLGNRESVEVYWNASLNNRGFNDATNAYRYQTSNAAPDFSGQNAALPAAPSSVNNSAVNSSQEFSEKNSLSYLPKVKAQNRKVTPVQQSLPQAANEPWSDAQALSKVVPAEAEFAQLVGESRDGMVARFLQNKL